jgi:hypothetical protein
VAGGGATASESKPPSFSKINTCLDILFHVEYKSGHRIFKTHHNCSRSELKHNKGRKEITSPSMDSFWLKLCEPIPACSFPFKTHRSPSPSSTSILLGLMLPLSRTEMMHPSLFSLLYLRSVPTRCCCVNLFGFLPSTFWLCMEVLQLVPLE